MRFKIAELNVVLRFLQNVEFPLVIRYIVKLSEILSLYVFWVFVIEYFSLSEFFVVRDLSVVGTHFFTFCNSYISL